MIPARGGSKRLPMKNVRILGGLPLIVWSINVAKDIPEICDIIVSTDDVEIAELARRSGAMVPWLRPPELATDSADSVDVCIHALDWYERECGAVDGLVLLQPTSPFRSRQTVFRGIELFFLEGGRPVVGVSPADSHPMWCYRMVGKRMIPFIKDASIPSRSQDLPPAYVINGALYLASPSHLRNAHSFTCEDMAPLLIDSPEEALDIDTAWDWTLAQAILQLRGNPV